MMYVKLHHIQINKSAHMTTRDTIPDPFPYDEKNTIKGICKPGSSFKSLAPLVDLVQQYQVYISL